MKTVEEVIDAAIARCREIQMAPHDRKVHAIHCVNHAKMCRSCMIDAAGEIALAQLRTLMPAAPSEAPEPAPPKTLLEEDRVLLSRTLYAAQNPDLVPAMECGHFEPHSRLNGCAVCGRSRGQHRKAEATKDHAAILAEKGKALAKSVLRVASTYERLNREDTLSMAALGGSVRALLAARLEFVAALADYERDAAQAQEHGGRG